MARSENQKLKLIYLLKIFLAETDSEHGLSLEEIQKKLLEYNVSAERKALYTDFQELTDAGYEVMKTMKNRTTYYSIPDREFELSELKLLTDAVQSAKFITEKKSNDLIRKLGTLASKYDAKKLQRQVFISGRVKSMNESIYYSVDAIHEAINNDLQIRFRYCNWNVKKQLEFRHDGAFYEISPWALLWDDEYYYLIGYDSESALIKHFRVDKMMKLSLIEGKRREGAEVFKKNDLKKYSKSLFGMYGGEMQCVTLACKNEFAGIIIDRFGKDIMLIPAEEGYFHVSVEVSVSDQFLSWVMALSDGVKIISPDAVTEKMKGLIEKLHAQYS